MPERTCRTCCETIEHIVGLIEHECDEILRATNLTRSEQDTLLYVEARVVDGYAELEELRMNRDDRQNLKMFEVAGILSTGTMKRASRGNVEVEATEVDEMVMPVTKFTDEAWRLAHECRQMRAARCLNEEDVELGTIPGGGQ